MLAHDESSKAEAKTVAEGFSEQFEVVEKLIQGALTLFLIAKSLGLFSTQLNYTTEQIATPVLIVFVGIPLLVTLWQEAFPQFQKKTSVWRKLRRKIVQNPWLKRGLFVVAFIAVAVIGWIWIRREFINQQPLVEEVAPLKTQLGPSESTELQAAFSDPDGPADIAEVRWTVEDNQGFVEQDAARPDIAVYRAPPQPGAYNVQVTVTDHSGKTASKPRTIYVNQSP